MLCSLSLPQLILPFNLLTLHAVSNLFLLTIFERQTLVKESCVHLTGLNYAQAVADNARVP